jgi:hypothetical protein
MAISTASHERSLAVSRVYSDTSPPMLCASLPSAFWLVICPVLLAPQFTARVLDALETMRRRISLRNMRSKRSAMMTFARLASTSSMA